MILEKQEPLTEEQAVQHLKGYRLMLMYQGPQHRALLEYQLEDPARARQVVAYIYAHDLTKFGASASGTADIFLRRSGYNAIDATRAILELAESERIGILRTLAGKLSRGDRKYWNQRLEMVNLRKDDAAAALTNLKMLLPDSDSPLKEQA